MVGIAKGVSVVSCRGVELEAETDENEALS